MKKLNLIACFAAAALTTGFGPAMATDFKTPIRGIDGAVMTISEADKSPLTLAKVSIDAMLANIQGGEPLTPDEKGRRFTVAMKIQNAQPLTVEEVATLKKVIGQLYGPLVVGRAYELLDPASVPAPSAPPK